MKCHVHPTGISVWIRRRRLRGWRREFKERTEADEGHTSSESAGVDFCCVRKGMIYVDGKAKMPERPIDACICDIYRGL